VPVALEVLFPIPTSAFSYLLPFDAEIPGIGVRVVVPWQQGLRIGLLVGLKEVSASVGLELKQIISVLDERPFVLPKQTEFILELAKDSCSPPGLVLSTLLATGLNEELKHQVKAIDNIEDIGVSAEHWVDAESIGKINLFREQGLLRERVELVRPKHKVLRALREVDENLTAKRQAAQKQALEWLWELGKLPSAAELARQANVAPSAVRALIKKGYIEYFEEEAPEPSLPVYPGRKIEKEIDFLPQADFMAISGGNRKKRVAGLFDSIAQT